MKNPLVPTASILATILLSGVSAGSSGAAEEIALVNPGFEEILPDGTIPGWTVLDRLDPHGYGPPDYDLRFDEIRPTRGRGGFRSEFCLAFPAQGTWTCPVFAHGDADGRGIDGKALGKAAVFQTIRLPAGTWRFAARLRTADGDLFSAAFALGVNLGPPAPYAHDGSTGIRWTRPDLAVRRDTLRGLRDRGEWAEYRTDPFTLVEPGPVTVWIRFDYANENQMRARWQADDARIVSVSPATPTAAGGVPCGERPPTPPVRYRIACGEPSPRLQDPGTSRIVETPEVRLFRRARQVPPGTEIAWRLPPSGGPALGHLLLSYTGEVVVRVNGREIGRSAAVPAGPRPTTRECTIDPPVDPDEPALVAVRALGDEPAVLHELELGSMSRTAIRCLHIAADTVRVLWTIGSWDASADEFRSGPVPIPAGVRIDDLPPTGPWEIAFRCNPRPGHRYYLLHAFLRGRGAIDVDADGLEEWIMETRGMEVLDYDITDRLRAGGNRVRLTAPGGHDFAALVETCPGAVDPASFRASFESDDGTADLITRVAENTWFWLRELHYEPSGFVDASVPGGRWYGQYWPIDIAFALREWLFWGYREESERIVDLVLRTGWQGHESNRSGGWDNNGGYIIATIACEIARRSPRGPAAVNDLRSSIRSYADGVVRAAEESPWGLIRGTNWENAGNREHGPCYALTTTLGSAAALRKAAQLAETLGESAEAARRRKTAADLRRAALDRLVLREDHPCPGGFVLPAGTWAYGLRTDGSIEDQPLAGYFWAATADADAFGAVDGRDPELLAVYDRTLVPAAELERHPRGRRNVVSGYAVSYDGPESLLCAAVLCDRVDLLDTFLRGMLRSTDVAGDRGSEYAELSRWAFGGPRTTEDTNLVCAAGWLQAVRMLLGIDDMLTGGRQLALAPCIPWTWRVARVRDWPVRVRDARGEPCDALLTWELQRDGRTATLRVATSKPVRGLRLRLGPFDPALREFEVTVDGMPVQHRREISGDAGWVRTACDTDPGGVLVRADAAP